MYLKPLLYFYSANKCWQVFSWWILIHKSSSIHYPPHCSPTPHPGGDMEAVHQMGEGQPSTDRRSDFGDQEGEVCLWAVPPLPLPPPWHLVWGGTLPSGVLKATLRKRGKLLLQSSIYLSERSDLLAYNTFLVFRGRVEVFYKICSGKWGSFLVSNAMRNGS